MSATSLFTSPFGQSMPNRSHALTASMPKWDIFQAYRNGDVSVMQHLQTGYPRLFIHPSVPKLARYCEKEFASSPEERAYLVRSEHAAEACCAFVTARGASAGRIFRLPLPQSTPSSAQVYCIFFPSAPPAEATQFWRLTGLGISSRLAEHCLQLLQTSEEHLKSKEFVEKAIRSRSTLDSGPGVVDDGGTAKAIIRHRVAGLLAKNFPEESTEPSKIVSETDVYLYPTGMTAIWFGHQLCMGVLGDDRKSVVLGISFVDSPRVFEMFGPGSHFIPQVDESSLDELEDMLASQHSQDPSKPPILCLFTEFPSNPVLRSVNVPRLRALADQYDFALILDDTIGTSENVHLLPYADILVTSLTKIFSGTSNVMGGSLVLNPAGKYYSLFKSHLEKTYEDIDYDEDAITLEYNSRDVEHRTAIVDGNAEAIVDFLVNSNSPAIAKILYPKYRDTKNFKLVWTGRGYGYLFSVICASYPAAVAFMEALPGEKGGNLGTNFTLSMPYAKLAYHPDEYAWATEQGCPEGIVRISVGMEDREALLEGFAKALKAAEGAHIESGGLRSSNNTVSSPGYDVMRWFQWLQGAFRRWLDTFFQPRFSV